MKITRLVKAKHITSSALLQTCLHTSRYDYCYVPRWYRNNRAKQLFATALLHLLYLPT